MFKTKESNKYKGNKGNKGKKILYWSVFQNINYSFKMSETVIKLQDGIFIDLNEVNLIVPNGNIISSYIYHEDGVRVSMECELVEFYIGEDNKINREVHIFKENVSIVEYKKENCFFLYRIGQLENSKTNYIIFQPSTASFGLSESW